MKAMSFENWQLAGFHVKRGEHATGRDKEGKPTFTRDQVDNNEERRKQDELDL